LRKSIVIDPLPETELTDNPSAELRIYLLGLPRVALAQNHLDILRREVRALLYRLANRLEPISREQLCYLFWPNTPESTARRALSHLLTHLRNALPAPEVIEACNDYIELNHQLVWIDTVAFEQRCDAALLGHHEAVLQQGLDFYRGPFLSGFALNTSAEFEAWVLQERCGWERLYLEALAILIEEQTARGAYEAAIVNAQRYLCVDDLAEAVHRRLIELYAAIGNRLMAIRQFEICAAVLGRELNISPQPMTWAVYRVVYEGGSPLTSPR
jgi:DNA-binding SARP family transcriptional activator